MTLKILAVHRYRPDMPSLPGFTTARCSPADTPPSLSPSTSTTCDSDLAMTASTAQFQLSPSPLRPPAIPASRCQPRPHNSKYAVPSWLHSCALLAYSHHSPPFPPLALENRVVSLDNCCHVDPEHCSHVDPEHLNSKPPCSFCEIPPFCKRT